MVEVGLRILLPEEPEASAVLADVLRREGVDVRAGVGAERVAAGGAGVRVLRDGDALEGSIRSAT